MINNEIENNKEIILINPYEILGIKKEDLYFCSNASDVTEKYQKIKKLEPNNKKLILSYYMVFNSDKLESFRKNYFYVKVKDQFYYVIMGDLNNLKKIYDNNKYILEHRDAYNRTLLHYAVIGEYYDICEFLLNEGINYDEPDLFHYTALYHASGKIKELLKTYGAYKKVYNADISKSINLENSVEDKIGKIYNDLYSKGLVLKNNSIYKNNKVIAKRLIRYNYYTVGRRYEEKNWTNVYHGTKYVSLVHILFYGLRNYGEPLIGHIGKNETINEIKDWASAIFVTPSIFYAKNYSEIINSNGQNWYIIVEAKVKPGSYTSHDSTIYNYNYKKDEPRNIEYRIRKDANDFYAFGGTDEFEIFTTSLLFVEKNFLDNLNNYFDASILEFH